MPTPYESKLNDTTPSIDKSTITDSVKVDTLVEVTNIIANEANALMDSLKKAEKKIIFMR